MYQHSRNTSRKTTAVPDLMSKAVGFHQSGALAKAEKLYKRILKTEPGNADALHLSGLVAHQLGRHPRAIQLINRAIRQNGAQSTFHTNLANIFNQLGKCGEAEAACRRALALNADDADAYNALGQALAAQGRPGDAVDAYQSAVRLNPAHITARINLASQQAGTGDMAAAVVSLEAVLAEAPSHPLAMSNLATILRSLGRLDEAEGYCRKAIALDPDFAKAIHGLGMIQSTRGQLTAAAGNFERAYELTGDTGETLLNLATVYAAQSKFDEAIALFEETLTDNPNSTKAYFNMGVCYSEKGDMVSAVACFHRALEFDPRNIEAYYSLGTSGKDVLSPDHLQNLALLSGAPNLTPEEQVKVEFALAAQAERQGATGPAFSFYLKGNDIRRRTLAARGQKFMPEIYERTAENIETLFTPAYFAGKADQGIDSERPVFIVGMPRSGTTLAEKIASSHGQAAGAGERSDILLYVENLVRVAGEGALFPDVVDKQPSEDLQQFAGEYLSRLNEVDSEAPRIIDKMPANFMYLGLIAIMFPQAKIIHCKRDPRDTGLSCFFQNFVHDHPWSCDLGDIGVYYRTYERVMAHWQKVLPIPILDLHYEDVVRNQEAASRKMIDFLGLAWDPRCLDFHRTEGAVRTASKWQVRQPIYTKSVGRWKEYEPYLAPLLQALAAE